MSFAFQRAALSGDGLTKVTLESFLKWKERKVGAGNANFTDTEIAKINVNCRSLKNNPFC